MAMQLIDFTQLMQNEYPEPKWAVPKLIPEGLTLLVGRPKMGKSWLALSLALEVASGGRALGSIPVKKGKAVYFALEDNERRLQARCASLMDDRSIEEGQLLFSTTIDKFYKKEDKKPEENGLAQLENLIDEMGEELRVIFIDTSPSRNPQGPSSGSDRVLRGGSWNYSPSGLRAAFRDSSGPSLTDFNNGFRCVSGF